MNLEIKQFGLIGKKLQHSFSKQFFEVFFQRNQIIARYDNFEIDRVEEIPELFTKKIHGFNVTIPYKEKIIPFLDQLSAEAREIGAVNCVQMINGKTIGHNTDAYGFHQLIKPYLTKHHQKAIILGTGGASKAIKYVLNKIGIDCIFISRTPNNEQQFSYSDMNQYMIEACKLIVNCTPIGMFPDTNEHPNLPFQYLNSEHLVVDLIYNPEKTRLLQKSEKMHAQTLNGKTMLVQQALKSWEIWRTSLLSD